MPPRALIGAALLAWQCTGTSPAPTPHGVDTAPDDADADTDTATDTATDTDCDATDFVFSAVVFADEVACDPCPADTDLVLASAIENPCPQDVYLVTTSDCIVSGRSIEEVETGERVEQVILCDGGEHAWTMAAGETRVTGHDMGPLSEGGYLGTVVHDDVEGHAPTVIFDVVAD